MSKTNELKLLREEVSLLKNKVAFLSCIVGGLLDMIDPELTTKPTLGILRNLNYKNLMDMVGEDLYPLAIERATAEIKKNWVKMHTDKNKLSGEV